MDLLDVFACEMRRGGNWEEPQASIALLLCETAEDQSCDGLLHEHGKSAVIPQWVHGERDGYGLYIG